MYLKISRNVGIKSELIDYKHLPNMGQTPITKVLSNYFWVASMSC